MSKNDINANPTILNNEIIKIITHHCGDGCTQDLIEYMQYKNVNSRENLSFNDFIKATKYPDQPEAIIIADLRNSYISDIQNLQGANLSGCLLQGVIFDNCDLKDAVFRDSDLQKVLFKECILTNSDFRGADLGECKFQETRERENQEIAQRISGIKFSFSDKLMKQYLFDNQLVQRQFYEKQTERTKDIVRKINDQDAEVKAITDKYGFLGWAKVLRGGYQEQDQAQLSKIEDKKNQLNNQITALKKEKPLYYIDPSLLNIMEINGGNQENFDPAYVRGDPIEASISRQYISINEQQIDEYLEAVKSDPKLSLNDFTERKLLAGEIIDQDTQLPLQMKPNVRVVANCSNLILEDKNFQKTQLQGGCFAGAKLINCNFDGANLDKATFENANVAGSKFNNTTAIDANFFKTDLSGATISGGSNFTRAFMSRSSISSSTGKGQEKTLINNVVFDYASIRNAEWSGVEIIDSNFNHADMEGIALTNAYLQGVRLRGTKLSKAVMDACTVLESDFTAAIMDKVSAKRVKFSNVILEKIDANNINLSESIFERANFTEANLENAILEAIKAEEVNFRKANLAFVQTESAKLRGAILADACLGFANLQSSVLDKADLANADLRDAILQKVSARETNFKESLMSRAELSGDFTAADLTSADLKGTKIYQAILEKAKVHKAQIDRSTSVANDIKADNLEGEFQEHGINVPLKEMEVRNERIKQAQQIQAKWLRKGLGLILPMKRVDNFLEKAAGLCDKASDVAKSIFSTKIGRYMGGASGLAIGGVVALNIGTAALTGGASLAVTAVLFSAIVAGCTIAGAISGHFTARAIEGVCTETCKKAKDKIVTDYIVPNDIQQELREKERADAGHVLEQENHQQSLHNRAEKTAYNRQENRAKDLLGNRNMVPIERAAGPVIPTDQSVSGSHYSNLEIEKIRGKVQVHIPPFSTNTDSPKKVTQVNHGPRLSNMG